MANQSEMDDDAIWSEASSSNEESDRDDLQRKGDQFKLLQTLKQTDKLYNPKADELDEQWVAASRGQPSGDRKTDAVLSCPLCFVDVCLDCQQHDVYKNQYRAMFVINCKVMYNQILRYGAAQQSDRQLSGTQNKLPAPQQNHEQVPTGTEKQDIYHPVCCESCGCEIGVYDHEEVYHFFHVIAE